ncbi:MAG: hypothetical protein KJO07_11665, partial [Deltaproteobacteria bacterium]|nr:hypothetical protein [Deltaproteobacteria bacterium]
FLVIAVGSALVVGSPAVKTAVGKASPEFASRATTGKFQARMVGGFRMEGAPEVEVVFGDTHAYRARIDRFFVVQKLMQDQRREFSRRVQGSLAVLIKTRRGCPSNDLAPHYYGAHRAAEEFRRLGIEFETHYTAIRTLHRYGESQGLTPDYRWKVKKISKIYRAALTDYREMQVALVDQLDKDLGYRGCKTAKLLNLGEKRAQTPPLAYGRPAKEPRRRRWRRDKPKPVVPASTVTFFVDNRTCKTALNVHADGALLGEVPARKRVAFQTLAGNHALCLIRKGDKQQCGQAGTVRTAYIHDGWAMAMQCRK